MLKKLILLFATVMLFICFTGCSKKAMPTSVQAASLKNYENQIYNISLKYDPTWKLNPNYNERYEGKNGFFQVGATDGKNLSIDQVAKNDASHDLYPFGRYPKITKLTIQGQDARLIMPSEDQSSSFSKQAELVIKYPKPVNINGNLYSYLVIWADIDHINEISSTIQFLP